MTHKSRNYTLSYVKIFTFCCILLYFCSLELSQEYETYIVNYLPYMCSNYKNHPLTPQSTIIQYLCLILMTMTGNSRNWTSSHYIYFVIFMFIGVLTCTEKTHNVDYLSQSQKSPISL